MKQPNLFVRTYLSNHDLARRSASEALRARREYALDLDKVFCVFDLLERAGVELRFVGIPSLEGMYVGSNPPLILVGSERPPGRQRLTAAHEFAHHWFGHGTCVDELHRVDGPDAPPQETLADLFAAFFLMPKSLVVSAFVRRGWKVAEATPEQVFAVAGWLGVGYSTLVTHLRFSLGLISGGHAAALVSQPVKLVRASALSASPLHDGLLVDESWSNRAVDAFVGDLLRVPLGTRIEGNVGVLVGEENRFVLATSPGLGRLDNGKWAAYIRVSERGFTGRARFRHLPRED